MTTVELGAVIMAAVFILSTAIVVRWKCCLFSCCLVLALL
jgi:hypothetical protein